MRQNQTQLELGGPAVALSAINEMRSTQCKKRKYSDLITSFELLNMYVKWIFILAVTLLEFVSNIWS